MLKFKLLFLSFLNFQPFVLSKCYNYTDFLNNNNKFENQ